MGLFAIFDINSAGMSVEQSRLAVASANIANARTTRTADGEIYQPLEVTVRSTNISNAFFGGADGALDASQLPRPVVASVDASNAPVRKVYDPGHPEADERGFVTFPGVDPVSSMLDLMSISRSYEANLRAFDVTRNLVQRTLDMWRSR